MGSEFLLRSVEVVVHTFRNRFRDSVFLYFIYLILISENRYIFFERTKRKGRSSGSTRKRNDILCAALTNLTLCAVQCYIVSVHARDKKMVLLRKSVAPCVLCELEFVRQANGRETAAWATACTRFEWSRCSDAADPCTSPNQWPCRERSKTGEIHESTVASTTHKAQVTENTNRNGVRTNRNMNERLPTATAKYKYQIQRY